MAWFRRSPDAGPVETPAEAPLEHGAAGVGDSPVTLDTVGNPIIERHRGRHVADAPGEEAPELPSRAEHRMLQLVAEGRVARTVTGGPAAAFWRIDGAFATGTKAMMLDWLLGQGYIAEGRRGRVAVDAVLTASGAVVLHRT